MSEQQQQLFKLALKELCQEFDVSELVCVADLSGTKTAVVQVSLTDRANPFYNNLTHQLSTIVTECGKVENINNG